MWFFSGCTLLIAFVSLVSDSDYSYWLSSTEVSKNYASYQSCVNFCNSWVNSLDSDVSVNIVGLMCSDGDNRHNPYAVWPANSNPYASPMSGCANGFTPVIPYCKSCASVVNDWEKTRDAAVYLRVKSYLMIVVGFAFCIVDVIAGVFAGTSYFFSYYELFSQVIRALSIVAILFYLVCFICSCVYVSPLLKNYGQLQLVNDILAFRGGGIPVHDMCITHLASDIVLSLAWCLTGAYVRENLKLKTMGYGVPSGSGAAVEVQPVDMRLFQL